MKKDELLIPIQVINDYKDMAAINNYMRLKMLCSFPPAPSREAQKQTGINRESSAFILLGILEEYFEKRNKST